MSVTIQYVGVDPKAFSLNGRHCDANDATSTAIMSGFQTIAVSLPANCKGRLYSLFIEEVFQYGALATIAHKTLQRLKSNVSYLSIAINQKKISAV